jgi:acetylornithine deacetylase/succinyl-diaminopimelate desuccinylase-like protein
VDARKAQEAVVAALTADPPSGARITIPVVESADGWAARPLAPWLRSCLEASSTEHFGQAARTFGEGGSIPFMGMLGEQFPEAQIVVTGVLGPESNAHGPNEFLDLPTAERITSVVADVLQAHGARS